MNAVVPMIASAPIVPSQGLVPTTLSEAIKLAEMMAASSVVPKSFRGSPPNCLLVIMQAVRWRMDPFAVIQECSVIQDKVMYSGKLTAAVVNTNGELEDRLTFIYDGNGAARAIIVSGRLPGEKEPRTVRVLFKDARTTNTAWDKQPDQQLMYHGSRVWARRHRPELMLGVWSPEELDEAPANKAPVVTDASPIQPVPIAPPPQHDPVTGEVGPRVIALPEADTEWRRYCAWAGQYVKAVEFATSLDEVAQWEKANAEILATIEKLSPNRKGAVSIHERVTANVKAAKEKLAKTAPRKASPRDASPQDADGIPPFLDRREAGAPTPEQPEDYLEHIDKTLKACRTREELDATWAEAFQPQIGNMFPPDAAIAMRTYEDCVAALAEA